MSEQSLHNVIVMFRKDIETILELAWDLECGISWYDVDPTKKKLNAYRYKYKVDPYDIEDSELLPSIDSDTKRLDE